LSGGGERGVEDQFRLWQIFGPWVLLKGFLEKKVKGGGGLYFRSMKKKRTSYRVEILPGVAFMARREKKLMCEESWKAIQPGA